MKLNWFILQSCLIILKQSITRFEDRGDRGKVLLAIYRKQKNNVEGREEIITSH